MASGCGCGCHFIFPKCPSGRVAERHDGKLKGRLLSTGLGLPVSFRSPGTTEVEAFAAPAPGCGWQTLCCTGQTRVQLCFTDDGGGGEGHPGTDQRPRAGEASGGGGVGWDGTDFCALPTFCSKTLNHGWAAILFWCVKSCIHPLRGSIL